MITLLEPPVTGPRPAAPNQHRRLAELSRMVSASRLSLWLACRLKFYFKYVLHLEKPATPARHAGKTVHEVLRHWNSTRWRQRTFSRDRLRKLFDVQWERLQPAARAGWDDSEEASEREAAWRALEHYLVHGPIRADEKPLGVELPLEADLSRHGLPKLVGILDLVRPGGRIVEFKIAGRSPDPKQVLHLHAVQLSCYSVLYRVATGRKESCLELHHLIKTRIPKLVISIVSPATQAQLHRLFGQIESYQAGVERMDFVPSPGFQCAGCEYFQECRRWCGGKGANG